MTAISSIKPFSKSPLIAANQLAAHDTWKSAFDAVYYVGPEAEPQLADPHTHFVKGEDFPTIASLVAECTRHEGWSCILNGDILTSFRMRFVEHALRLQNAQSAISLRWQLPQNAVVDQGLDWFAATQELWQKILPRVPKWFRISHCLWDTWILASFHAIGDFSRCYDVTASKVVFHPQHEERERPYAAASSRPNDGMIDKMKWPTKRLNVLKDDVLKSGVTQGNPTLLNGNRSVPFS